MNYYNCGAEKVSLKDLIKKALNTLYEKDWELLCLGKDERINKHVGERAIVFRFGIYFQQELNKIPELKDLNLDCEYNRKGTNPKSITIKNRIMPDIILHQRGNNNHNLLVLEFKGWWNKNQEYDKKKIERLIDNAGEYGYKEGYTILLDKRYSDDNIQQVFVDKQL